MEHHPLPRAHSATDPAAGVCEVRPGVLTVADVRGGTTSTVTSPSMAGKGRTTSEGGEGREGRGCAVAVSVAELL